MTDHAALAREWQEALGRRKGLAASLGFWTVVLEGWSRWPQDLVRPLRWSSFERRERWERGVPLAAEAERMLTAAIQIGESPGAAPTLVDEVIG